MGVLIRVESNDGHTIDVHGGDAILKWEPRGVTDFREGILSGKPLPMVIHGGIANVIGPTTNVETKAKLKFQWSPSFAIKAFALVAGGWLPAALCESTLLLPDENLAGSFSLLDDEASRVRAMTALADVPLLTMGTNRISAAFAAFEGGPQRYPSCSEFGARFKSIAARLQRGFPHRQVVDPTPDVIAATFALLQGEAADYERYSRYLAYAFPLVSHRIPDAMLSRRHAEVDELAEQFGVPLTSFVHLLVVDCLYDEGPTAKREQRPGRLVLKPKKLFTGGDLRNALSDVMHMERLCRAHLGGKGEHPVLCTLDQGLTQAWAMLGPQDFRSDGLTFSLNIDNSFAPRLGETARRSFFKHLESLEERKST